MTTLSSGNSVTVTLSPDQYVTVTTAPNTEGMISVSPASASANLESGSPANTAACQRFGPPCVLGKKYGPYGDTVNLTLHPTKGIFTAPPVMIPANCTGIIHYARVYLKASAAGVFKMRAASSFKTI